MTYQEFKANKGAFTVDEYANVKIVEKLEKVKKEIKEEAYSNVFIREDFYELGYKIVNLNDINKIIDKYISELKGSD